MMLPVFHNNITHVYIDDTKLQMFIYMCLLFPDNDIMYNCPTGWQYNSFRAGLNTRDGSMNLSYPPLTTYMHTRHRTSTLHTEESWICIIYVAIAIQFVLLFEG